MYTVHMAILKALVVLRFLFDVPFALTECREYI